MCSYGALATVINTCYHQDKLVVPGSGGAAELSLSVCYCSAPQVIFGDVSSALGMLHGGQALWH